MNLHYKILWFEDDPDIIDDYAPEIRMYLEDRGFSVEIIHQENGDQLSSLINDEYDLILTDLNLGDHETGDKLIERLREDSILTEVLFYSGNEYGISKVIEKHRWVERVSFSVGIENLATKIKQLISLTVKKVQEVNNIRGLVMAQTSELDSKKIDIIVNLFEKLNPEDSKLKKQELINKTIHNRAERLEKLKESTIDDIDSFCRKLESNDRLNAIIRLVKYMQSQGVVSFEENKQLLETYKNEILDIRNALAHAKEIRDEYGNKKVISDVNGANIEFTDESCSKIRKDLRKHHSNFDNLLAIINDIGN
ncbi:hypothetical protein BLGI_4859 [Brevibacillus laterosporus GI-9]|uniref:response regulator n=1 Tax=Brevibacillus laterosporus TaxID=1465 RepID=UPI00024054B3|nr:response regulator [Brevibacillus laterosporus]CCF16890.1 hypothetical protein BLGI_4859 [Brevibacillus laterosporus GI-9]